MGGNELLYPDDFAQRQANVVANVLDDVKVSEPFWTTFGYEFVGVKAYTDRVNNVAVPSAIVEFKTANGTLHGWFNLDAARAGMKRASDSAYPFKVGDVVVFGFGGEKHVGKIVANPDVHDFAIVPNGYSNPLMVKGWNVFHLEGKQ